VKIFGLVKKKNSAAEKKKFGPPSDYLFLKEFGHKKHYICLCEWENNNISWALP
jgi:hypothetical protein